MRTWNRARLLWGYLRRHSRLNALPVEYIVETTAKCNLYCPMCPREIRRQPKEDMADEVFQHLIKETGRTAEHMMLIGLGEPFLDPKIFERIDLCARHGIATLLSTNGTLLDTKTSQRLLRSSLEHITLSIDGVQKESFEYYRKGADFEKVRGNFLRFCQMKKELNAKMQVVVQMVRMERNAGEVGEFLRFWRRVPGVDEVRVKEDETNLMVGNAGHNTAEWKYPCHYLWRGPIYVKQNGDVYPCCQSYMLGGEPLGRIGELSLQEIWNSAEMERMRRLHRRGRAKEIDICSRCCTAIPHPALVVGSLLLHGRVVRRLLPWIERIAYYSKLPRRLLRPARPLSANSELVQTARQKERER